MGSVHGVQEQSSASYEPIAIPRIHFLSAPSLSSSNTTPSSVGMLVFVFAFACNDLPALACNVFDRETVLTGVTAIGREIVVTSGDEGDRGSDRCLCFRGVASFMVRIERLDVEPASDIGVLVRVKASDVVDVRFEAKASPMSSSSCMTI